MASPSTNRLRIACSSLLALAVGACGPRPGPTEGAGTDPAGDDPPIGTLAGAGSPTADLPLVLGVPLGEPPAAVAAALGLPPPESAAAASPTQRDALETDVVLAGVPGRLTVSFHERQACSLSFATTGADATEAAYRALAARVAEDLGPGNATRCESEDGIAFDSYLATGHGRLETEWRGGPRTGSVSLRGAFAANGSLRLEAFVALPDLLPMPEEFVRGPHATPRLADRRATRPSFPFATKQAAAGCTADLSGAPPASLLDLPFGADRTAIETKLGRPFEDDHGQLSVAYEVAGVPGRLHLRFWAGCLAVLMFMVDDEAATPANYLVLRDWARTTALGPGDGLRCLSEAGIDEREYIAAGFGLRATNWHGGEPLDGRLWLHRPWSGEPGAQISFEADYRPLDPYAPQYDFDGAGPPGGRPWAAEP